MFDDNIRRILMEDWGQSVVGEGAAWLLQKESIVSFPHNIHCPSSKAPFTLSESDIANNGFMWKSNAAINCKLLNTKGKFRFRNCSV